MQHHHTSSRKPQRSHPPRRNSSPARSPKPPPRTRRPLPNSKEPGTFQRDSQGDYYGYGGSNPEMHERAARRNQDYYDRSYAARSRDNYEEEDEDFGILDNSSEMFGAYDEDEDPQWIKEDERRRELPPRRRSYR